MEPSLASGGDLGRPEGVVAVIGRRPRGRSSTEDWRHPFWPSPSLDRFVVSYPKAGRTWLRVMLAVAEAHARGARAEAVVEEWLREDAPRLDGRRVLFTHALSTLSREPPDAVRLFLRYIGGGRRVFLVRDPRDVVVSHFFQLTRRAGRARDVASIGEFVRDERRGVDRILRFLLACELSLREDDGPALLVSYERLQHDPATALEAVLRLLDAPAAPGAVEAAVEFARFDKLRELERSGGLGAGRRLDVRDDEDPESRKIRRGKVGGYVDYLSQDDVAYVESRIAELLPAACGYSEPGVPPEVRAGSLSAFPLHAG